MVLTNFPSPPLPSTLWSISKTTAHRGDPSWPAACPGTRRPSPAGGPPATGMMLCRPPMLSTTSRRGEWLTHWSHRSSLCWFLLLLYGVRTVSLIMNAQKGNHRFIFLIIYKWLSSRKTFQCTQKWISVCINDKCKIYSWTKISFPNTFPIHTQMCLVLNKCFVAIFIKNVFRCWCYIYKQTDEPEFTRRISFVNLFAFVCDWSVFICRFLRLSWRGWIQERMFFSTRNIFMDLYYIYFKQDTFVCGSEMCLWNLFLFMDLL